MEARIWPGLMAILFGSLFLFVIIVPLIAANYRKFGRLSPGRIVVWGAFTVYAFALLTYTMLPLPEAGSYECVAPRFAPGASVTDIAEFDTSSARALLTNPAVLQIAFNVLLFMPLGLFARLLWGRGVVATTLIGLGISLFIETSQLTGLWGIYPCAYRLFDVDDIIVNTSGALIGALLAALLRLRPVEPRGELGPRPITFGRRFLGMLGDLVAVGFIGAAAEVARNLIRVSALGQEAAAATDAADAASPAFGWAVALGLQLCLVLLTGRTVGDLIVNVRYEAGSIPPIFARPLRFLGGIGGYMLLSAPAVEHAGFAWAASAYALIILIWAIATPDRSGLAGRLSGQRVVDGFRGAR
ncbi:glycopeptide antibiotics resistance protein [Leucobacter komagatae]|uniref:Glycopeptide antibiotics resistance protein n=1 Tax=Leucobacter komagatae TaxID=55969 RepID=A0A542Y3K8_9MICO|nr:VanZ family protein [Leucobacter komagatae]TQL42652.1 glycopeptide antibiotics resistance protein [Leucobacter komagatae]